MFILTDVLAALHMVTVRNNSKCDSCENIKTEHVYVRAYWASTESIR